MFIKLLFPEGGKGGGGGGGCLGLTALPPTCAECLEILVASACWSPKELSRPVVGYFCCIKLVIMPLLSKRAVDERSDFFF